MANPNKRYSGNIDGNFYVDKSCISCGQCMGIAPYNFTFTTGDKHAIVNKQPETEKEKKLCMEALKSCPANAIGAFSEHLSY